MEFALTTVIWLALVTFVAALTQGFLGFGFGLVGMSLSAHILGVRNANLIWSLMGLLLVALMCARMRHRVEWKLIGLLFLGSMVGTLLGVKVLAGSSEFFLRKLLGVTILLFALYHLVNFRYEPRQISHWWGLGAGLLSGFFSGSTSAGGPPAVIFLLFLGLEKDTMKASLAAYFLLAVIWKIINVTLWKGLLELSHVKVAAMLSVALPVGMVVGMYSARYVPSKVMKKIICLFLFVPATLLLVR